MSDLSRIRDDLFRAIECGEVSCEGPELYQLASDLLACAFPEAPKPESVDPFSLLVGYVCGAAIQRHEDGL